MQPWCRLKHFWPGLGLSLWSLKGKTWMKLPPLFFFESHLPLVLTTPALISGPHGGASKAVNSPCSPHLSSFTQILLLPWSSSPPDVALQLLLFMSSTPTISELSKREPEPAKLSTYWHKSWQFQNLSTTEETRVTVQKPYTTNYIH